MDRQFGGIRRSRDGFAFCGLKPSTAYKYAAQGLFMSPIVIAADRDGRPRATGFLQSELDSWVAAKAAGVSDDELRALVTELVAKRKPTAATTPERKRGHNKETA